MEKQGQASDAHAADPVEQADPGEKLGFNLPGFGEPAPFFVAESDVNPRFVFSSAAGRWIVLAFLGVAAEGPVSQALDVAAARQPLFNEDDAAFFGVLARGGEAFRSRPGYRFFRDTDLAVSRLYGVTDGAAYAPMVYLLDRALRIVAVEPVARMDVLLDRLQARLAEEATDLQDQSVPVLTLPNIFEPDLCDLLVDHHRAVGGERSGFMRDVDGQTVLMHDESHKRRRDVAIEDEGVKTAIRRRIERRLLPMIERSLGWKATQMERYLIARYGEEDLGFFRPHRDNTTAGTAHRKFAVSINLNSDYDGGRLRFPEFGPRTFKPPRGGATVFSCSLLHEATPVTRGERFVFVPFLYDDEGAKIRAENLHRIKLTE